ncbi:MAG: HAMP domain-containing sensor histidine kinase [Candidatus Limnocylindria bacterium]
MPLFWRVCLTNGAVFVVGTAILAVSPATVSSPVLLTEAVVLAVGLAVILAANALLLRASLVPLDRLARLMERVDLLRPGERLAETGNGAVSHLIHSFNAMLARLEAERGASTAQALAAQEAERHRIAQELHDEVGQGLTAVLLGLKRAADRAPTDLREDLLLVRETARTSLDEVRQVARRLRPGVLEDLGLVSALTSLASDFTVLTGVAVRRKLDPGLPRLRSEVELVIYRIAQEGLTNVARHAGADTVELTLIGRGDTVTLRLTDDGTGLRDSREGAGMRGMRERAILVGADFTIGSRPGGGTELRLVVPVQPTPDAS